MDDDPLIALPDDPWTDEVHQPYTAFNQGYDAGDQGIPVSLNPYDPETREFYAWDDGHDLATERKHQHP